jgi:hypothetical protein
LENLPSLYQRLVRLRDDVPVSSSRWWSILPGNPASLDLRWATSMKPNGLTRANVERADQAMFGPSASRSDIRP